MTERFDTQAGEDGEVRDAFLDLPPEDLADTLDRYTDFHKRFVYHPDESTHDLAALWAAHTHAMDAWRATPRLYVVAPEPGCGKTTQAELLKFASHNGLRVGTTSTAGLFNIATTNTVFLDETDNLFTTHPERRVLQAVINDGYAAGGFVLRKAGPIPVYGALAFAGIETGTMPEPTRQRCIPIQMRIGEPAEFFDPLDHGEYNTELQLRLSHQAYEYIKPSQVNRMTQIWSPLFSVAAAAGQDWPERAQRAFEAHQWRAEHNEQKAVLAATRDYFSQAHSDRVSSSRLAAFVTADDLLPAISPKSLAGRMKGYGVTPRKTNGTMTYYKSDLEPVWREWLPTLRSLEAMRQGELQRCNSV